MKPDNKTIPLAFALAVGMVANIVAVAVTRPAMPKLPVTDHALPLELLQLDGIVRIGDHEFPEFPATWPAWRRSQNIEDCRPYPNRSFKSCPRI